MPLYSNVTLKLMCTRNYNSGVIVRTTHRNELHLDAPLPVSKGIVRNIGAINITANTILDDYTIMDIEYSGNTLTAREKRRRGCDYQAMDLILYTVSPRADLHSRNDAVLVRRQDVKRVVVISGGGYTRKNLERSYDDIILKSKHGCGASIIAIQHNRNKKEIGTGDYIYIVSRAGVKQVHLGYDDPTPLLENNVSMKVEDWVYV